MHTNNSMFISSQSAEKKEDVVHLQSNPIEPSIEMTELKGKCHIGTFTKTTENDSNCFPDELKMVKKISSAKDLELHLMQLRVKFLEGEYTCICLQASTINITVVHRA